MSLRAGSSTPRLHLNAPPETEPLAPAFNADYVKVGQGTWQPIGLALQRVIGRIFLDEGEA